MAIIVHESKCKHWIESTFAFVDNWSLWTFVDISKFSHIDDASCDTLNNLKLAAFKLDPSRA